MPENATGGSERDLVEVNVGYDAGSGKEAALNAAVEVVREFDSLDVVTVRIPRTAMSELSSREDVRYVEENGSMDALDG